MSIKNRLRWPASLALGAAAAAVLALAVPAGASTGTVRISPEQAGYSATGAQFKTITAAVYLRNPTQYASEVASFAHSVQLWSSGLVVSFGARGDPTTGGYDPFATIYDRATHQVIASNPNPVTCEISEECYPIVERLGPGTHSTWTMKISYSPATGRLVMYGYSPFDQFGRNWSFQSTYTAASQSFTQARVGTEFGASLWDASYSYTPPAGDVRIATYNKVALTTYSGHTSSLWSWWVHHKLLANTGQQTNADWVAVPTDLYNGGASFQTWFVPESAQGPRQPTAP
jgi:hypothetical protein